MSERRERPRRRAVARVAATLFASVVLALALMPAQAAHAHASLQGTDPPDGAVLDEAPAEITLSFNEPVQPVEDAMRLVDAAGRDHPVEATARDNDVIVEIDSDLGEGGHSLNWRVISADAHPISGVLAFSVGTGSGPAQPVDDAATAEDGRVAVMAVGALHYLGLLVFTGFLFFRIVIARSPWPPRPRHRLLRLSAATAVAAAAAAVPIGALEAVGLPLTQIVEYGSWRGAVQAQALTVLGLTAAGLGSAYWWFTRGRAVAAALAPAAVATAAPVLIGHSRLFEPGWLMLGSDVVHLFTAAFWAGGLIGLLILLRHTRLQGEAADPGGAATVVARFSAWAGFTVAVLGASGLTMAVLIHRTWDDFFGGDHGMLLLVKLAVVALALALAGWNRYRLVPTIRSSADARSGLSRLRRVLSAEALAVGLAVVLTGVLVHTSPDESAAQAEPATVTLRAELGAGEVTAELTPGSTGANTLSFELLDAEGHPLEPIEEPLVHAFLPAEDFGPVNAPAVPDPGGGYTAELDLPLSGTWELEIHVRVSRFEEHRTTLTADVG